mgnify:CR=1 FL=1
MRIISSLILFLYLTKNISMIGLEGSVYYMNAFFCVTALSVALFLLWCHVFCKDKKYNDEMDKDDRALIISFFITMLLFIIVLINLFAYTLS